MEGIYFIFLPAQIFQNLVNDNILFHKQRKKTYFINMAVIHIQVIIIHLCNKYSLIISCRALPSVSAVTVSLHANERNSHLSKENLLGHYHIAKRIARDEGVCAHKKTVTATTTKKQAWKQTGTQLQDLDIRYQRNSQEQPAQG